LQRRESTSLMGCSMNIEQQPASPCMGTLSKSEDYCRLGLWIGLEME
jgi:hypothetical protein